MKFSITIGRQGDILSVINGPSLDWSGQVDALRELTNANGQISISGKKIQLDEAVLLHSSGESKSRKFKAALQPAKKSAKKLEE